MPLKIAIVGRPNVGKSTLFNRLVGKKLALVDDRPGVTRDRREAEARLGDLDFTLYDTAGLEEAQEETLSARMTQQTLHAMTLCDVILFMIDVRVGLTPDDRGFANLARKSGKPIILLANKAESKVAYANSYEAFSLGLGDPVPISAEHGEGMSDLFQAILPYADEAEKKDAGEKPIMVAVVGRPNAGKSTLVNALIGEERLLVGPEAGITRDSISVDWEWQGQNFRLVDTAGLRRKAKIDEKLEKLSVSDTLRALRYAEVVIVCMDLEKPFEDQDLRIADLVVKEGRSIVIAFTKSDLIVKTGGLNSKLRTEADHWLPQVKGMPVVAVSAFTREGLEPLMKAVVKARDTWSKRISTSALNRWLGEAIDKHPPPGVSGRRIKIRYMTQVKARPPTFVSFCSRPDVLPESYERYLINSFREAFEMYGAPIRFMWRKPDNPYDMEEE
jgi:GTPase